MTQIGIITNSSKTTIDIFSENYLEEERNSDSNF